MDPCLDQRGNSLMDNEMLFRIDHSMADEMC